MLPNQVILKLKKKEAKRGCIKAIAVNGRTVRVRVPQGARDGMRLHLPLPEEIGETFVTLKVKRGGAGWLIALILGAIGMIGGFAASGGLSQPSVGESVPEYSYAPIVVPTPVPWEAVSADELPGESPSDPEKSEDLPDVSPIPHLEMRESLLALSPEELCAVENIYAAAADFAPSAQLEETGLRVDQISRVRYFLHMECPELFQVDNDSELTYYTRGDSDRVISLDLKYTMSREQYEAARAQCEAVIADWCAQTQDMDEPTKEKRIYDALTENLFYDEYADNCGNAYGALIGGKAKCDGISLAMKWAMEEAGMHCLCVSGTDLAGGPIGHAWNLIRVNGQYFDVDVTADVFREGAGMVGRTYPALNVDKTWVRTRFGPCEVENPALDLGADTMDFSFHAQNGSYVSAGGDWQTVLAAQFERWLSDGTNIARLQFADGAQFESALNALSDTFSSFAERYDTYGWAWEMTNIPEYRTMVIELRWQ